MNCRVQILPIYKEDSEFIYKGVQFPYCSLALVAQQSIEQSFSYPNKSQEIILNKDVSVESFGIFIDAIDFHEITVTEKNALELMYLSIHFSTKAIKSEISKFFHEENTNPVLVIKKLILEDEMEQETSEEEKFISERISDFIGLKEFADIPIQIIDRIISKTEKVTSEEIYKLIKLLNDGGKSFGRLQKYVDYDLLTPESGDELDEIVLGYLNKCDILPKNFVSLDQQANRHNKAIKNKDEEISNYVEVIKDIFAVEVGIPNEIYVVLQTKFLEACEKGRIEFIKQIIAACSAQLDSEVLCKSMKAAIINKHINIIQFIFAEQSLKEKLVLLAFKKKLNFKLYKYLHCCMRGRKIRNCKVVLWNGKHKTGATRDSYLITERKAINVAIENDHLEIVKLLLTTNSFKGDLEVYILISMF